MHLAKEISRQNTENAKWLLAGNDQIQKKNDELNKKLFSFGTNVRNIKALNTFSSQQENLKGEMTYGQWTSPENCK